MALIGDGAATAVAGFLTKWQEAKTRRAELKAETAKIKQDSLDANKTDDWIIGTFMFLLVYLVVLLPLFTFLGASTELRDSTYAAIATVFQGDFGALMKYVVGGVMAGGAGGMLTKRWATGKLAHIKAEKG